MALLRGAQPFAVLLCTHTDQTTQPYPQSFFQEMFGQPAMPSHAQNVAQYWKDVSHGTISIGGTIVFPWSALPWAQATDMAAGVTREDRVSRAVNHLNGKVGNLMSFAGYIVIYSFSSPTFDLGGERMSLTLGGTTREVGFVTYGAAATVPFGLTNFCHEMGHALGFEHSFGVPKAGLNGCYDDSADIMGSGGSFTHPDPSWAPAGPGINAPRRLAAGWLVADYDRQALFPPLAADRSRYGSRRTGTFSATLATPDSGSKLPQQLYFDLSEGGGYEHYLSFEARRKQGWDAGIDASGVCVYVVVDGVSYTLKPSSNRAVWTQGETLWHAGMSFTIDSVDATRGEATIVARPNYVIDGSHRMRTLDGRLHRVSAGSRSSIWGVNADQRIYKLGRTDFTQVGGALVDVSASADGEVWGVNQQGNVFRWDGSMFLQVASGLVRVAAGSANNIWGLSADDTVHHWNGSAFDTVSGLLRSISAGADGTAFGVNAAGASFVWSGRAWDRIAGVLTDVSCANLFDAVGTYAPVGTNADGTNADGKLFRYGFGYESWEKVTSAAVQEVDVAEDGTVWSVDTSGNVIDQVTGQARGGGIQRISVGSAGWVLGIDASNTLVAYHRGEWLPLLSGVRAVSTAADGTTCVITLNGSVSRVDIPSDLTTVKTTLLAVKTTPLGVQMNEVAVGGAREIWGLDSNGNAQRMDPAATTRWRLVPGATGLTRLSVTSTGVAWATRSSDSSIHVSRRGAFEPYPNGLLQKISAGIPSDVWGISSAGDLYKVKPGRWLPVTCAQSILSASLADDGTLIAVTQPTARVEADKILLRTSEG